MNAAMVNVLGICGDYIFMTRIFLLWLSVFLKNLLTCIMACGEDLDFDNQCIEDDVDNCSITAVNGDSEERVNIDPPCVYHPTLEDF
jgi:hypothetical protein